jgi:hypothetical protein
MSAIEDSDVLYVDEDPHGDDIQFQVLEISDEVVDELDTVLIPMSENGEIITGKNLVFDFFLQQTRKSADLFGFVNDESSGEGWEIAPHKINSRFYTVGFVNHRESIIAYLNRNASISSDNTTRSCFFSIQKYNEDPLVTEKLIPSEDYETFDLFMYIPEKPMSFYGQKYFLFPASQYLLYKNMNPSLNSTNHDILVFGINGFTHGSLYRTSPSVETKMHYLLLDDPLTHLILSHKRRYDFIAFHFNTKKNRYLIDGDHTHPVLARTYASKREMIDTFFNIVTPESITNHPFIHVKKNEKGGFLTCVSALYMEHVIQKQNLTPLTEAVGTVVQLLIDCGKKERFIMQKQEEDDATSSSFYSQRPFYLVIEDSVYKKTVDEIQSFLD